MYDFDLETHTHEEEDELLPSAFDQKDAVFEKEFIEGEDGQELSGLSEYGFGFWARWSRTGPVSLFSKATWHTLCRMTKNRNHGDIGTRDRTLAIWVGVGYYHFTTYTPGNNNVAQNIPYKEQLDGSWNFIYFAYKRFANSGKTHPVVILNEDTLQEAYADVLHDFVTDYLRF